MTTIVNDGGAGDGIEGSTDSHGSNGVVGLNKDPTPRNAATPKGNGVFGSTLVPDGAGVFGLHNTGGVGVAGFGHPAGIGVVGISAPAGAKGGDGVLGVTNSEHRNGMVGRNDSTTARAAADAGGNGVLGFTQVPDGAGVFGIHATTGIGVAGLGLIGMSGGSVNGVGVMGVSAPPGGKGGDGVQGITNSEFRNGVYGRNDSTTKRNNADPAGNGVFGYSRVPDGCGVLGAHGAGGHGVIGTGGFGMIGIGSIIGVWGQAKGTGWAGYFTGPVRIDGSAESQRLAVDFAASIGGTLKVTGATSIGGTLNVTDAVNVTANTGGTPLLLSKHTGNGVAARFEGDVEVTGDIRLTNADCAEDFDIAGTDVIALGTVMVLCGDGALAPSERAYDKRVAGVLSGAGSYKPGIVLDQRPERGGHRLPVALVGKVFCKVDADRAPVEVGDLLTTSDTPGHAMKATDPARAFGAVIGKALRPLGTGQDLIPILVALQ